MTPKVLFAALALTLSPAIAAAAGCSGYSQDDVAQSCAEGSSWDSDAQACVPQTTS